MKIKNASKTLCRVGSPINPSKANPNYLVYIRYKKDSFILRSQRILPIYGERKRYIGDKQDYEATVKEELRQLPVLIP